VTRAARYHECVTGCRAADFARRAAPQRRAARRPLFLRAATHPGRWPLIAPLYHSVSLRGRPVGYVALPVLLEGLLFVGVGAALARALANGDFGVGAGYSVAASIALLQLAWHGLHIVTRWGGRVRLVPKPWSRAFRGERVLVSILAITPPAIAAWLGVDPGIVSLVAWIALAAAHLQCEVRWLIANSDLWTLQWEIGERRTAFGPRHTGKQRRFWEDFFRSVRNEKPDARMVDIGCGNLDVSQLALGVSKQFELHATDTSYVDKSRWEWARDLLLHRWPFEETEYPTEYLDALTSSNAIEYSSAFDDALAEVFRILRQGARAAMLIHHPDSAVVAHFRESYTDSELLKSLNVEPVVERFLRTQKPEDKKAVQAKLTEMRNAGRPAVAKQAKLIAEFYEDPHAALPWLEFKDTLKRNYELAETLPAMADSLLSDFDSLREHFVKAGFEIERFERFECEKDVVNYAVLVRRPWRDEVFGLGDAYVGYENSVTRALPRDAARGTVKELLRRQKKNFHEANGTEIAFKADRTAQSIAAILGEDCLRSLPIEEVERTNAGVIYRVPEGARAGSPVPAGASTLFDLREDGDAWIG